MIEKNMEAPGREKTQSQAEPDCVRDCEAGEIINTALEPSRHVEAKFLEEDQALEKSPLFKGIGSQKIREALQKVPHKVASFEKGEIVFHLSGEADQMGVILSGRVQAQKPFPNGSQVNLISKGPGELIGPIATFSKNHRYPCDMVVLESARIMMFFRPDLLRLLQENIQLMENFISELATTGFLLQNRLELLSYSGIAQKAAFFLLTQSRQTGQQKIRIPDSISNWALTMNVSRSSLHRELKRLEEENILSYTPPFIQILDAGRLQDVLSR